MVSVVDTVGSLLNPCGGTSKRKCGAYCMQLSAVTLGDSGTFETNKRVREHVRVKVGIQRRDCDDRGGGREGGEMRSCMTLSYAAHPCIAETPYSCIKATSAG